MGKQRVVAAVYEHKYGMDVRVFRTVEQAYAWRTSIAEAWWDMEFPDDDRPEPEDIGEAYFDGMHNTHHPEFFTLHESTLEGE